MDKSKTYPGTLSNLFDEHTDECIEAGIEQLAQMTSYGHTGIAVAGACVALIGYLQLHNERGDMDIYTAMEQVVMLYTKLLESGFRISMIEIPPMSNHTGEA